MSQILNKVRDVDANNSDAVKDALSGFFQNLPNHTQSSSNIWLRALENVINRFPKYCMSHRNTIEAYLVHFLDSKSYHNVIEAAKCGHSLQQVRPSQEKTATPKVCWREQMDLLCSAAHSIIGAVFTNDVYRNGGNFQKPDTEYVAANTPLSKALADITDLSDTNQSSDTDDSKTQLCLRLHNVFVFIQAMLVEPYPVAKPVRPQGALDVILRALTVSSGATQGAGTYSVKTQALRTLDALVLCLGPNMIPFSPLVFRMVMQTLRWSSENPSEESRSVRIQAYASLSCWLSTLGCHAGGGGGGRRDGRGVTLEEELAGFVAADVTPRGHAVQLTMSTQPTKHMSKKAKRKLANTMLQESHMATRMPGEKNKGSVSDQMADDVAVAALECAEVFLTVCGIFLKPATHKLLQERLVRECYRLDDYPIGRALGLCRALEAARRAAPPGLPPPTQYCLQLYSVLRGSRFQEISRLASQALLEIRLHLHCSPPSLGFAAEPQRESDTQREDRDRRKEVSEKNRAALEELLGPAKMKSIIEKCEVITIPDEPANKKPRLSDEDDKISVSSQSSVEIAEDSSDDEEIIPIEMIIQDADVEFVKPTEKDATDANNIHEDKKLQDNQKHSTLSIHEQATQLLPVNVNISGDTVDGTESPLSIEVAYDYPSTGKSTVKVLEKMEHDNLPSSTDTVDIQITCGQQIKSSQDLSQKKVENEDKDEEMKVNGLNEKATNGDCTEKMESSVTVKITEGVTVEDMLADFVDEVNDEIICVDP